MRIKYDINVSKFMFDKESIEIYEEMKAYVVENNIMVTERDRKEHPLIDDVKRLEGMSGDNQLGKYAGYMYLCGIFKIKKIKEGMI